MPVSRSASVPALHALMATLPQVGRLQWIGLRPARDEPMAAVAQAQLDHAGLVGDRHRHTDGRRAVTLVQAEHLAVIAALSARSDLHPALLRRNLMVSGMPLLALKGRRFKIGECLLEATGPCDPCSRMEAALGPGGYNAMRGHGGITARVLAGGRLQLGDAVAVVVEQAGTE
jgi:MOSC domain-containing protein YiiM